MPSASKQPRQVVGHLRRAERPARVRAAARAAMIEDQRAVLLGELRHLQREPAPAGAAHAHHERQRDAARLAVQLVVDLAPLDDRERHAPSLVQEGGPVGP